MATKEAWIKAFEVAAEMKKITDRMRERGIVCVFITAQQTPPLRSSDTDTQSGPITIDHLSLLK